MLAGLMLSFLVGATAFADGSKKHSYPNSANTWASYHG